MGTTYEVYLKKINKEQEELNVMLSSISLGRNYIKLFFDKIKIIIKFINLNKKLDYIFKEFFLKNKDGRLNNEIITETIRQLNEILPLTEEYIKNSSEIQPIFNNILEDLYIELRDKAVELSLAIDEEVLDISEQLYNKLNASVHS